MRFTVTHHRDITIEEGWGVDVCPIFSGEDEEPERVADIVVSVARIAPDTITYTSDGMPCVEAFPCVDGDVAGYLVPVENFSELPDITYGDTHDLRTRWFATESEARDHARYTADRFAHPSLWESFVALG